jgi:hypothetical protein
LASHCNRAGGLTNRCTCHAAVRWLGAEAPASACATASRQLQFAPAEPWLVAATAAPRRSVPCEAGVQVNDWSVGRTKGQLSGSTPAYPKCFDRTRIGVRRSDSCVPPRVDSRACCPRRVNSEVW